jgi:AcrR family transcriptional regulator
MDKSGRSEDAGRSTSRDRQRLDTRERVYQAALAEFGRVGFAQTQIERVVELARVSVGTFYRYFPGKDGVLLELEQRLVRETVRHFTERVGGTSSLRDLLHLFAEAVLADPSEDTFNLHREAVALIVRTPWPTPDWSGHPLFGPVTAAFAKAQASGEIRKDIAPDRLTQILSTSLFGFAASLDFPSTVRVEDARLLIDLFLQGLRLDPAERLGAE